MWAAGAVAAMSSITFPAVSALVSRTADADQQGMVDMRQICILYRWNLKLFVVWFERIYVVLYKISYCSILRCKCNPEITLASMCVHTFVSCNVSSEVQRGMYNAKYPPPLLKDCIKKLYGIFKLHL